MSSSRSDVVTQCVRPSDRPFFRPFFSLVFMKFLLVLKCFYGVSRLFKGCLKFKGGSRMFQGNFNGVYRKFQGCLQKVSRVFQGCFKSV